MRITIDLTRKDRVPRIRSKWQTSSRDDLRMVNLGIALYNEWAEKLGSLKGNMNGKEVVIENLGDVSRI